MSLDLLIRCTLDEDACHIYRRLETAQKAGSNCTLSPRQVRVLVCALEEIGKIVGADEIDEDDEADNG